MPIKRSELSGSEWIEIVIPTTPDELPKEVWHVQSGEYVLQRIEKSRGLEAVPMAVIVLTPDGTVELRGTLPEGSAVARLAERLREWYAGMVE